VGLSCARPSAARPRVRSSGCFPPAPVGPRPRPTRPGQHAERIFAAGFVVAEQIGRGMAESARAPAAPARDPKFKIEVCQGRDGDDMPYPNVSRFQLDTGPQAPPESSSVIAGSAAAGVVDRWMVRRRVAGEGCRCARFRSRSCAPAVLSPLPLGGRPAIWVYRRSRWRPSTASARGRWWRGWPWTGSKGCTRSRSVGTMRRGRQCPLGLARLLVGWMRLCRMSRLAIRPGLLSVGTRPG
jgi:hypothetical protein